MLSSKAIYVIVLREFKRFYRQRGRVLVTVSRPLLWLFIVGAGFTSLLDIAAPHSYVQFILPGVIGMTILFSAIFSTISVVWDREFGFLREMLVSPASRFTIVMGKLLAGTALSVVQGVALLVVAPFLGLWLGPSEFIAMVLLMTLVSLAITAFGLVIASYLDSLEGFNVIMNFIVLPMFFLSGALYPISALPWALAKVTLINPLSYGVDSFKHVLLVEHPTLGAEFPLLVDIGFVLVFTVVMTVVASLSFERR